MLAKVALALATARDTAPMAMLPWRTGSGGSGGKTGFSKRVSLRPVRESIEKGSFFRNLPGIKPHFFAVLTEDPARGRGEGQGWAFSAPRDFQICWLSSIPSSSAVDSA